MESYCFVYILFVLVVEVYSKCYKLEREKNHYMTYETTGMDFAHSSDFELTFKTTNSSGLLYYAEGEYIDDEAPLDYEGLYIYKGMLNYFIFNPTKYGGGFSRGGHVRTDFEVNNGTWVTVEFFRNKEAEVPGKFSGDPPVTVNQTGIIVNGEKFVFDKTITELDVAGKNIYIGGHDDLSVRIDKDNRIGAFDGLVDMFKDLKSNAELTPNAPGDIFESDQCDRGPSPYA